MIFVYPAIVSENVDTKIGPAVCKVLEQYYLLHLAESFSSGNLRVKTIFDYNHKGSGTYGPLMLENKKTGGKTLLEGIHGSGDFHNFIETRLKTTNNKIHNFLSNGSYHNLSDKYNTGTLEKLNQPDLEKINNTLKIGVSTINDLIQDISNTVNEIINFENKEDGNGNKDPMVDAVKDAFKTGNIKGGQYKEIFELKEQLENLRSDIERTIKLVERYISSAEKKEEKDTEKKQKDVAQYETHGNYKVETMKGISFKPSMMNINVKIHYLGGPHEDAKTQIAPSQTFQEISIGCKIAPLVLKNFSSIEDAILDDYFSTNFQVWWKTTYRNTLRKTIGYAEHMIKKLTGANSDITSKMNPVDKEILLAPQGFINASSFKQKSGSPGFYHYSSAMVVLNKDDLVREESTNFFLNKSQLNKMFKMGWNAFCILDPTREEATFISSMDGGALHVIPYSFIFHTLGMEQIYANMSDLQRRSPIFRKSSGNLNTLVSRLKRESSLLKIARQLLKS